MLQDIATIESKYQLFVEKIAATKLVWGLLSKEGWANSHSNNDESIDVIPFWSDRAYAKACARDDWRSFSPTGIPLAEFLEDWCAGMANDNTLAGINWDANMFGKESNALDLTLDILTQLKNINSTIAFKSHANIDEFIAYINQPTD